MPTPDDLKAVQQYMLNRYGGCCSSCTCNKLSIDPNLVDYILKEFTEEERKAIEEEIQRLIEIGEDYDREV